MPQPTLNRQHVGPANLSRASELPASVKAASASWVRRIPGGSGGGLVGRSASTLRWERQPPGQAVLASLGWPQWRFTGIRSGLTYPVPLLPETLAVLGALPLAPERVAAERGFSPSTTDMGPTSEPALSLRRVRVWRRPLRRSFEGTTLASRPTSLLGVARVVGVLRRSKGHPRRPCVECSL